MDTRGRRDVRAAATTRELLRSYGIDLTQSDVRALQRIAKWIGVLHDAAPSREQAVESWINVVLRDDLRRTVCYLEGLLRLYVPRFAALRDGVEALADLSTLLGNTRRATDLQNAMRRHELPPAIQRQFAAETIRTREALKAHAQRHLVIDAEGRMPLARGLLRVVSRIAWSPYYEDRTHLCEAIARHMKRVAATDYDMSRFDQGIHAFRRKMKWLVSYIHALDGLVRMHDASSGIAAYRREPRSALAQSKYLKVIPDSRAEWDPVLFPEELFVAHLRICLDLGDIKDRGERLAAVTDAYLASGLETAEDRARKRAVAVLRYNPNSVEADAKEVYRRCKRFEHCETVAAVFSRVSSGP